MDLESIMLYEMSRQTDTLCSELYMKSKIYKLTGIGSREWSPRAGGRMENREILVKGTTLY